MKVWWWKFDDESLKMNGNESLEFRACVNVANKKQTTRIKLKMNLLYSFTRLLLILQIWLYSDCGIILF